MRGMSLVLLGALVGGLIGFSVYNILTILTPACTGSLPSCGSGSGYLTFYQNTPGWILFTSTGAIIGLVVPLPFVNRGKK